MSGTPVDLERLKAAHAHAFGQASTNWRTNRQYVVEHAVADMLGHLDLTITGERRQDLVPAFSDAGAVTPLHLAPGIEQTLTRLHALGLRLGIVCDVGLTPSPVLRDHLERRGLLNLFHHWSFSDETGDYKPATAPFMHACSGLGVEPHEAAHVGDQRRTDVVGALTAGLTAVRYAGVFDDLDESLPSGDIVVRHHAELPDALGLA